MMELVYLGTLFYNITRFFGRRTDCCSMPYPAISHWLLQFGLADPTVIFIFMYSGAYEDLTSSAVSWSILLTQMYLVYTVHSLLHPELELKLMHAGALMMFFTTLVILADLELFYNGALCKFSGILYAL